MTKNKTAHRPVKTSSPENASLIQRNGTGSTAMAHGASKVEVALIKGAKTLPTKKTKAKSGPSFSKSAIICSLLGAVLVVGAYLLHFYLQEQRILSPFAGPLIPYDRSYTNSLLWGTYRPGTYFGVRSRTPNSLEMGLMWFSYGSTQFVLRHLCDQNDRLRYGWQKHDGRNFGYQEIIDENVNISTTFVKRFNEQTNDWVSRIVVSAVDAPSVPQVKTKTGLFIYFRLESLGTLAPTILDGQLIGFEGSTPSLGNFKVSFSNHERPVSSSFLTAQLPSATKLRDTVLSGITMNAGSSLRLVGQTTNVPNLIVYELSVVPTFTVDFIYEPIKADFSSGNLGVLGSGAIGDLIAKHRQRFRERFRAVFRISDRGYNEAENEFAERVFSNLIGGVGYFYGESLVTSKWSSTPAKYRPSGLFTAVPSRSFFPRGFLWDEGFHQLVISRWDIGLTREIMTSWFNLMNTEGWIPREQILGDEARSRVPEEFIVQNSDYANPPSFFLTIEAMMDGLDPDRPDEIDRTLKFLEFAFPRLQKWYEWFNSTQLGPIAGSYRWRGRNETTDRELNPRTLTSGLDDYPRASHPSSEERHVDLYCWMAYGAGVLARVAEEVGENPTRYRETELFLRDNARLDTLHWSSSLNFYADYGRTTDNVRLAQAQVARPSRPGQPAAQMPFLRVADKEPILGHVNAFGYVSLFPLILRILEPTSPKLEVLLDGIRNTTLLWTEYGIRSLAKNSPMFAKYNTEHDGPYWRGAVWINMNYLVVKALKFYSFVKGPYQEKARRIGEELKMSLVKNMFRQYQKTGYVWEQYVDPDGRGSHSHPFTGWSSLIVLIMSDF